MKRVQSSTGWTLAAATGGAALLLSACGASGYRAEHAEEREPETCGASEPLAACEQRLQRYASRLDALVAALSGAPDFGDRAAPTSAAEAPSPAASPPAPDAAPVAEAPIAMQSASEQASDEADEADEAGEPPETDCDAARDLRDRICELAAAICQLAERSGAAPETKTTCDSSRESCERARTRVAGACPE